MLHMTSTRTHTEKHAHPNARIYDANNFPYHAHSPTHTHPPTDSFNLFARFAVHQKDPSHSYVCVWKLLPKTIAKYSRTASSFATDIRT